MADTMTSTVAWTDGMAFDVALEGHHLTIDADEQFGGRDLGPRPKGLVLSALAGCTAMDVIAILNKMKVPLAGFSVEADADLTQEHPKVFSRLTLTYRFEGADLPPKKLRRAVQLSQDRYCGVSAMLRPAVPLDHVILVNGEPLADEQEEAA